ncbi:hypothetical protein GH714_040045 [Hevea brasiliensis]|uniref:non-specific serine/threonine protein kinase n=1 Tax=Hevea brasiliensis TaxID=3981 RepID=A0A6A6MK91_HEVBR|nr:hypothetical protein GH714_040045 [Hevea brasiliensis]
MLSLVGLAVWCLRKRRKDALRHNGSYVMPSSLGFSPRSDSNFTKTQSAAPLMESGSSNDVFVYSPSDPGGLGNSRSWFTYEELLKATNGFSSQNLLGEVDLVLYIKAAYRWEGGHPRVIHRDIKSSNILLDNNFEAKVSDFGLAKLAFDANTHVTTRVMGLLGRQHIYYLFRCSSLQWQITEKSDVFSYGVVLLELITGRKPVDASQPLGDESLVEWARPLLGHALANEEFDGWVDPRLEKNYDESEMFRMIEAAAACVRHSAARRPRMGQAKEYAKKKLGTLYRKQAERRTESVKVRFQDDSVEFHEGSIKIQIEELNGSHGLGSCMEEVERVIGDFSQKGEFAFGSFWGRGKGKD